jgi:Mrp family chromosome partitioning ATPase
VVLVAPVSAGSGASYVARNLAIAIAFDERRRAVLVDCDLRHPAQQAVFQVDPGNGLVDYLGDTHADPLSLLRDSGIARLQLLPAGTPRESSAEYFSTPRMRQLLDALRGLGPECHVFLDSPPVRGAPDARILSDLADVVVLVAGYGRDTPEAIAQAAANFDPGKFAGVVFNEGV